MWINFKNFDLSDQALNIEFLYTKSLVNTNSVYTNFTNPHFQKVPIPHLTLFLPAMGGISPYMSVT